MLWIYEGIACSCQEHKISEVASMMLGMMDFGTTGFRKSYTFKHRVEYLRLHNKDVDHLDDLAVVAMMALPMRSASMVPCNSDSETEFGKLMASDSYCNLGGFIVQGYWGNLVMLAKCQIKNVLSDISSSTFCAPNRPRLAIGLAFLGWRPNKRNQDQLVIFISHSGKPSLC
ncbi:hypothetical protein L1887_36016 [Cichorium endivia]|nr:hypothetical protein L1887_36016 [Cichorium endivia]